MLLPIGSLQTPRGIVVGFVGSVCGIFNRRFYFSKLIKSASHLPLVGALKGQVAVEFVPAKGGFGHVAIGSQGVT